MIASIRFGCQVFGADGLVADTVVVGIVPKSESAVPGDISGSIGVSALRSQSDSDFYIQHGACLFLVCSC